MLAASPVFGFLNYFPRMSNVGMVMHAVTLTPDKSQKKSPGSDLKMQRRRRYLLLVVVSRQLPAALDRYLAAVPAMSLTPVAPFVNRSGKPERHQIRLRGEAR